MAADQSPEDPKKAEKARKQMDKFIQEAEAAIPKKNALKTYIAALKKLGDDD
jgi:hypothetical protein